jgi:ribosomal protein S18 acetylase RimI-like enzyme
MNELFTVRNAELIDLPQIYQFFDDSIAYQEKRGYPSWRNYDRNAVINDIHNKNQYKIIVDSAIAIVFSVCYSDPVIWRELEKGDALYLHRIVVNPDFKGQKLFGKILEWSIAHAREKNLRYVRMDTWAANPTIIDYYKTFGFEVIENYTTPDTEQLPVHNRNLELTLLQLEI